MEILVVIVVVIIVFAVKSGKKENERRRTSNEAYSTTPDSSSALLNSTINKAKKFVEKQISKSYLTGSSWVQTNNSSTSILYTFRNNNDLLITTDGIVERAHYELIIDNNSILITRNEVTEHFNFVNNQSDIIVLNKVSSDILIVLENQTKLKDKMKAKFDKDIIAVKKSHSLQEAEEDKYKYIDEIEDFHVATLMTLKEKYKTQSSIEVIDLMEREAESFGV
jgi:hypothetical protein